MRKHHCFLPGVVLFLFLSFMVVPVRGDDSLSSNDVKDHWVQLELGGWRPGLNGDFLLDDDLGDTDVDLDGNLNLDQDTNVRARLELQPFSGHHFRLGYNGISFQETTALTTSVTVDGKTFSATDRVDSDLTLDTYELGYRFDVVSTEYVTVSPMFQVNVIDFTGDLNNETTGESVNESSTIPIPYPGVRVDVFPLDRLGIFGELRALSGGVGPFDVFSVDYDVGTQVNLTENYQLRAGYREMRYDIDGNDNELDLTTGGPYASVIFSF